MEFEEDDEVDEVGSINSNHNTNGDIQNGYARSYVTEETVDEDPANNLKFSLAHYFSTTFIVFVSIIITATIVLFIWSNTSDGAWVSLQVVPVLPSNTTNHNLNEWFPFAFSKLNSDSKTAPKSLAYILNALENNDNNMEKIKLLLSNNINGTLSNILLNTQDIKDLKLNLNVFHFSLVSAVSDFWQAEGYALSVLIAAFSGVWPYVKLILLGVCWLVPMKQENREGIIIFLDQMGKFSFIDLFVSLYMIVSFYVSITKTFEGYGINLKVIVEPDIGLNTFVIGTAISMIFSHIFLILDAKYAKPHIKQLIRQQKQQELDIQQNGDGDGDVDIDLEKINQKDQINTYHKCGPLLTKYLPSSIGGILLRSIMLLTIIYTVWGAVFSTFTAPVRYNITGLVGWAVSDPIRAFSPWEIITQVPTHTDEHEAAPPLCLTLFLTIVFFPILLNVIIFIIWYFPMKYKYLNYVSVFMQGCMAWSALDVFAVASIAASLELSRVSQWILNTNYASVCGPDGTIPHITEAIIGKKVQCFSVDGYLVWGIWVVLAVSIFSWILFIYTIQQLYQYKKFKGKLNHKNLADKTIFFFNH